MEQNYSPLLYQRKSKVIIERPCIQRTCVTCFKVYTGTRVQKYCERKCNPNIYIKKEDRYEKD